MFLNGVVFALGFVTGMSTLVGVVIGLFALAEWGMNLEKKQMSARKCAGDPGKATGTYPDHLLLIMQRTDGMDEPKKRRQ